jgi:hypothetical protein
MPKIKNISYQIRDERWNDLHPKAKQKIRQFLKDEVFPTIYYDYDKVNVRYFLKMQRNTNIQYFLCDTIDEFLKLIKKLLKQNEYVYEKHGRKVYRQLRTYLSITKDTAAFFEDELFDDYV